jgi:hypothetical protein
MHARYGRSIGKNRYSKSLHLMAGKMPSSYIAGVKADNTFTVALAMLGLALVKTP